MQGRAAGSLALPIEQDRRIGESSELVIEGLGACEVLAQDFVGSKRDLVAHPQLALVSAREPILLRRKLEPGRIHSFTMLFGAMLEGPYRCLHIRVVPIL